MIAADWKTKFPHDAAPYTTTSVFLVRKGNPKGIKDWSDLGALVKGLPRHPIVQDDVVIYAGATILGRVTIGRGSVIDGNVWLTRSVPPGATSSKRRPEATCSTAMAPFAP